MTPRDSFFSIYSHGFIRVAICVPMIRVANPTANLRETLSLARQAEERGSALALFPELGLSAYTNEDLFHQDALLEAVERSIESLCEESRDLKTVLVVGAPVRSENKLFNAGIAIHTGRILAVTPKTYLPNYREFYEKRQFTSGSVATRDEVHLAGQRAPFGSDILITARGMEEFTFHMEICEDVWAPIPPSSYAALAGATLLTNLSASNITIGKAEFRKSLAGGQSAKTISAYLYSVAGPGESTTDLAWDGDALIYENGNLLAEADRFSPESQLITADIDLERLIQDRMRMTSFNDAVGFHKERVEGFRRVAFDFLPPEGPLRLQRDIRRFPYVPASPESRDERCYEAYNIQVQSLLQRLRFSRIEKVVIGVSGGLDSTHALIVAAKTMDLLGLPRSNVLAYTMPGFATSSETLSNAWELMNALGVTGEEIDIRPSCMQMFADIRHPFARGEKLYDITFENVQAGERTSHLFRLANARGALVLGTGDLSELALGWTTYGVGDHMSHYNVNASVPKTLIQYLIRWVAGSGDFGEGTNRVLRKILETEISPELIPGEPGEDAAPAQRTEATIGPYWLQDFNLYYLSRFGFRPSKVAFLAYHAWADPSRGLWPEEIAEQARLGYDLGTIKRWLRFFVERFYGRTQFKRSCVPNSPKVGSGGSLSPRGDWRAPSDSDPTVWVEELEANVPE
ncbi:MAG: NAD(+) synthase [Alkalispirochaetaceae bacterium]